MSRITLFLLLVLFSVTCGRVNFDPETLVNRTRVLAFILEPPEVFVGETSKVTVKVINPQKKKYTSSFKVVGLVGGETTSGKVEAGEKFNEAIFFAPGQLQNLLPMTSINIEFVLKAGDEELKYRKLINIWSKGAIKREEMNINPTHGGISFKNNDNSAKSSEKFEEDLSEDQSVTLSTKAIDARQDTKKMRYRWYSTGGKFEPVYGKESKWKCTSDDPKEVTIFSVIRDLKGGMAYSEGKVKCEK